MIATIQRNESLKSPHWGYMIEGQATITYTSGEEKVCSGGDLFYCPPGHSVRAEQDSGIILFSPQAEHCTVAEHLKEKLTG